ncbi:MAG: DMT family transporter, partial [Bacteroidota bacterium]
PVTTVCLRIMIATVFMILLTLIAGRYQKIARKDIRIFMLFALVDPVAYFLCESYGLKLSSPTTAAVIIATIPLFTPIAAAIMTNEKVTLLNFTGIIVSFTGVLLVIVTKDFKMTVAPLGLLLLFGAVLCAVL